MQLLISNKFNMKQLIFYQKGCLQPEKDEVRSGLFTYQDRIDQNADLSLRLIVLKRRLS